MSETETKPDHPTPATSALNGERPSTPASAPQAKPSAPLQLDEKKLHSLPSEQQELYLLTFTASLSRHVDELDGDGCSAEQLPIKKTVFQVINLASPTPARVVRKSLGRCLSGLFSKGNRKLLYESINDLIAIVNAGKDKDFKAKHAATYCLGRIFEAAGDSAVSLSPLACTALLKQLKSASNDAGLRSAKFRALGRIVKGIVASIDEDVGRAIWKQARAAAAGDKSLLVQASACQCLEMLVRHTTYFDNSSDFDKVQYAIWKAMESASVTVRHAAASCLSTILVKSYSDSPSKHAVPRLKKPKKSRKGGGGEDLDDGIDGVPLPASEKPVTTLSHSLFDIMRLLSNHYSNPATTNKARSGIALCYIRIFKALGESVVEENYTEIARHLFKDLMGHPSLDYNKYKQLITRKFVRVILERAVGKMLGETAQLNACRFLLNDIIKDYPQTVKERPEPSKAALIGAASALTSLIGRLDAATGVIAELCREALLGVLQHPNYTVQVYSARALRAFVLANPQQLLPTVTICMNIVNRELNFLSGPRRSPRRCIGYAYGLAAILSTASHHPLYGSVDVYARVLQQATGLLKSSANSDLRISGCQLQVAWIMIGGLMSLGPNFVKIHLNQLMLLWKNALPQPFSRDNISQRNMFELSYLCHVRECALGSMKAFLTFNQRLLTSDVSRRLSSMLENTVVFIQALPDKKTSEDPGNRLSPALQLQDYEIMVRKRVFQCFSQLLVLGPAGSVETTAHATVLPMAVATFSDADYSAPNALSAAIATAAGSFETIWDVSDNYGFGINSVVNRLDWRDPVSGVYHRYWTSHDDDVTLINQTVEMPVCGSAENDGASCYVDVFKDPERLPCSATTEAVNAAIASFALSFPLQIPKVQDSTLSQIASSFSSASLQKDPARRAAMSVNTVLAILTALRVSTGETGSIKGDIRSASTEKALQALLWSFIQDHDEVVRRLAAEALGRLCSISGSAFTAAEITQLTELIVNNREPHVRAGSSLALACIHSELGGMAAGLHMKTIVGILMSLAADSHPLVHLWALDSLAQVAESAGLNFSGYVTSAIGMLSRLYTSDSHNAEITSVASSNMSLDMPVSASIARCTDSIIHVSGPDLQDMTKQRDMIMTLTNLYMHETESIILLEALKCMEHLSLYAPGHLNFEEYVHRLQTELEAESDELSTAAINGLFSLMRRDATEIVRTARPGLEERLWECLNADPNQPAVRNIFLNWLQQTGPSDPAEWIARCNAILTKTKAKVEQPQTAQIKETAGPEMHDEEVAGFAAAAGVHDKDDTAAPSSTQELMRWQVRLFAMNCLHSLIAIITKQAAITEDTPGEAALQQRVADVVRIAFSASTASVVSLRLVGLRIIDQILKLFGKTPDPDFQEAMLLEQYQAQISSALTPAFAADSSPELAAEAVNVCASFISTGIVTDIDRMGRILKLLVSALESFSRDAESATIGDLKSLSANAQVMVRTAVFAAWAELQIASGEQKYLVDVVKPHISKLAPLWLAALREFARLRFEPDISASNVNMGATGDLDTIYAALNRQTLLKFYQASWLSLVEAIASLIDEDSDSVFQALDSRGERAGPDEVDGIGSIARKSTGINYREEPVAFFFVLFGLAFESLAMRSSEDDVVRMQRNLDILAALTKILRPSVSGNAIYQDVVFTETMDLLDRMVLMESLSIQAVIVEIARNLCMGHPSSRLGLQTPANGDALSDDIEQLFELTRIIILVLTGLIPGLSDSPVAVRLENSDEAVALVRKSLQALVDVSEVFPSIIKTDLHASILHIFVTILGTGACQSAVVPQALPILRRFVASITDEDRQDTEPQLKNALSRLLIILKNAQKREFEASIPCEKNALLAATILISTATKEFSDDDRFVQRFLMELADCLHNVMTSRIAAGCVRTLLVAGIGARQLLPIACEFLSTKSEVEGLRESKALVAQTLVLYTQRLPEEQRSAMVTIVVHVLLAYAVHGGRENIAITAKQLVELAGIDNAAFRATVGSMPSEQKTLLEKIVKAGAAPRDTGGDYNDTREPTIALKLDFGG